MMKALKRLTLIICCLVLISSHATADQNVSMKPEKGMPDQEEIVGKAKSFFAQKCGVSESDLPDAFDFAQYGLFGYGVIEDEKTPVWLVGFSGSLCSRSNHAHTVILDKQGEVLYWSSHGAEHWADEPDILETATPAVPLSTDATPETVVSSVQERLLESGQCTPDEIALMDYQPHFIYERRLDQGFTPFYLVDVYQQETLVLRALYTYDGTYLSIVKPGEDFAQYDSPDPVFSDAYPLSQEQWLRIPYLSVEEKYQEAEKMRPYVEAWIERYPYYLNNPGDEFDMTLRNHYAVPDAQSISQAEAIAIARTLGEEFGISMQSMDDREVIVHYLLDDHQQPFWRITICRAAADQQARREDDSLNIMYAVKIDAHTGNVLDLYQVSHDTPDYEWRY